MSIAVRPPMDIGPDRSVNVEIAPPPPLTFSPTSPEHTLVDAPTSTQASVAPVSTPDTDSTTITSEASAPDRPAEPPMPDISHPAEHLEGDAMDTTPDSMGSHPPVDSADLIPAVSNPGTLAQESSGSIPGGSVADAVPAETTLVDPSTGDSTANEITPSSRTDSDAGTPPSESTSSEDTSQQTTPGGSTDQNNSTNPSSQDEDHQDKPEEEPAYWADIEEDTSAPDEAELKEIESADGDYSALEYDYWEKSFYRDVDDPEYQPSMKARMTWKFNGVRGTKKKPNRATIMRSPAAYIGGYYWTIKFFPRGNSVSALSIYIECSPTPPKPDKEIPATEFRVVQGPPNANLTDLAPCTDVTITATADSSKGVDIISKINNGKQHDAGDSGNCSTTTPSIFAEAQTEQPTEPKLDWRVSAQIGVILYNPSEPRTGWMQSSCHQFNPHNLDWGWTSFHGPWDQIHQRQRGQRQALLRNDTLAFDAYIRIFDDPTQALWWHSSDSEPIWDSLSLTGYRPMGDAVVNHSPEVAGLVSWLLLAPFREVIQGVNILEHLTNPQLKPRPLCDSLQKLLWTLRNQPAKSQLFVDTDPVTRTLRNLHEFSGDVIEFWERLRRTLELELAGTDAIEKLSKIFDSQHIGTVTTIQGECTPVSHLPRDFNSKIRVPADNVGNVQTAVRQYLSEKSGEWSLPLILHVELARQRFDKVSHQWNMLYDRVRLDEELDLSDSVPKDCEGKYSLYGFIVHKGKRTSGQFYSILRPGGPNSKWLAFEDASDNKVECLTRKAAIESHEGVDPTQSKDSNDKSTHDVAVVVMYVRNDVLAEFLTGRIEPWEVPEQRKQYFESGYYVLNRDCNSGTEPTVKVEAYALPNLSMINNSLFDSYDLMSASRSAGHVRYLTLPATTTFMELRKKLALWMSSGADIVKAENIRLWQIGARKPLFAPTLHFQIIDDLRDTVSSFELGVLRLWVQVLSKADAKIFSLPDPEVVSDAFDLKPEEPAADHAVQSTQESSDVTQNSGASVSADADTIDVAMDDTGRAADPVGTQPIESPASGQQAGEPGESQSDNDVTMTQNEDGPPRGESLSTTISSEPHRSGDDVAMADADPTAITAVNANDLEEPDHPDAMDAEPTPPPGDSDTVSGTATTTETAPLAAEPTPSSPRQGTDVPSPPPNSSEMTTAERTGAQQDNTDDATHQAEEDTSAAPVSREDSVMQDAPNAAQWAEASSEHQGQNQGGNSNNTEDSAPEADDPPSPPVELVAPTSQVYYFIQKFDPEKQELRALGVYFSKKDDVIKPAVRAALGWPEDKHFLLWHRVDGISIVAVSGTETFNNVVSYTDGECFVVGDVLTKAECTKIAEAGSFASPDRLVQYMWALSRDHPTQAFTGTKTIDATFNGDYYSGEFKKGYYHGKGTHISDTAATYIGDFVLGQRHGNGTMEYASGDTYKGDWVEDQRHGQGTFVERKTGNKYVGGYRNGKRHGKGISYWEVADEEMDLCQICYSEDQDALFYNCGHVCACVNCAKQVEICPMCRKKVVNVVKIYKS